MTTSDPSLIARQARPHELDAATATITLAFSEDPVWSVALARSDGARDHQPSYWRMFVDSAAEQGGAWVLGDAAAVSIWIPPDGRELTEARIEALDRLAVEWLGEVGARELVELFERFEAAHPHETQHAYLSLLATHPDHRGRGIGQALLAQNLARWDSEGVPSYLESTNPGNDHRYLRAGFRHVGRFEAVRDDASISTMWRDVGGAS